MSRGFACWRELAVRLYKGRPRARPLLLIVLLLLLTGANLGVTWPREHRGDLDAFLASGRAWDLGLDPYLPPQRVLPVSPSLGPNANPPIWLFLFVPLARLEPGFALRLVWGASLTLYLLCLGFLVWQAAGPVPARRVAWALAMTAPWYTLALGQMYCLLLPFMVGAWCALEKERRLVAGLCLGALVAAKPNFAFWAVLLLVGGQAPVTLTAALASALPLAAFGSQVYRQWLAVGAGFAAVWRLIPADMSLMALSARLGVPELGMPLSGGLLLGTTWLVARLRPQGRASSKLALTATLIASPRAWVGYGVFLVPLFLERRWTWPVRAAALLLLAPWWLVWGLAEVRPAFSFGLGLIYPLALALLLVSTVQEVVAGQPQAPLVVRG